MHKAIVTKTYQHVNLHVHKGIAKYLHLCYNGHILLCYGDLIVYENQ